MTDNVEKPSHYTFGKYECIDVVWKLKTDNLSYLDVLSKIEQWINNQIVICYMNDNLDRDLSIEIMGNGKGMMAI